MHANRLASPGGNTTITDLLLRLPPLAGGIAAVALGVAGTSIAVWVILSVRGWSLEVPTVAALSLATLYVGFFVSVFAGIEVMRAAEAGRPLTVKGIGASVAAGFADMLCAREIWRRIAAICTALVRASTRR